MPDFMLLGYHFTDSTGLCFPFACSVYVFIVDLGENIQGTELWPVLKNYFHMAYWILNYKPGVTTQPANCEFPLSSLLLCVLYV